MEEKHPCMNLFKPPLKCSFALKQPVLFERRWENTTHETCDLLWCLQGCVVKLSSSLSIFNQAKFTFTLLAFCTLNPSTCLKNTFSSVYMDTCSHWHAHVKSRERTVSATEWKMNFHRLTDSFVQLLLKGLKSVFNDMEPFILFHVSHISCYANFHPLKKKK